MLNHVTVDFTTLSIVEGIGFISGLIAVPDYGLNVVDYLLAAWHDSAVGTSAIASRCRASINLRR